MSAQTTPAFGLGPGGDADDPEPARALALALRAQGRLDEAMAVMDPWIRGPSVRADIARIHGETRHAQALTLLRAGQHAAGVALLWRVVADHPGDEQAHLNLARILFAQGQRDIPAGLLAGLAARRPDLPPAVLAELALLLAEAGSAEAAEAAALGRPVWLLSRYDSCYRWLRDRDDSPWYPSLRMFRQITPGDWTSVIARVAEALRERAA